MNYRILAAVLATLVGIGDAHASSETFQDWTADTIKNASGTVCYISAKSDADHEFRLGVSPGSNFGTVGYLLADLPGKKGSSIPVLISLGEDEIRTHAENTGMILVTRWTRSQIDKALQNAFSSVVIYFGNDKDNPWVVPTKGAVKAAAYLKHCRR